MTETNLREEMRMSEAKVLMHKQTGQLVEYYHNTWAGEVIFYDMMLDTQTLAINSPILFCDDPNFPDLNDYEDLGEL